MIITVQYEMTIARRGILTTTIKEKTFKSEEACEMFFEQHAGNATPLRYLSQESK
jgi:hypothetical protein